MARPPMSPAARAAAFRALWAAARQARRPGAPGIGAQLKVAPRMILMGLRGEYPHLDRGRLARMALATAYLASPVDLVPELLVPVLGLGDDAVVLAWLTGSLLSETEAFLRWEETRGVDRRDGTRRGPGGSGRVVPGRLADEGTGDPAAGDRTRNG